MGLGALALFLSIAGPVRALDAYQDRTGFFWGASVGGGTGITVPGGEAGGAFHGDLQLGAGVTKNFTLALNVGCGIAVLQDVDLLITVITPGPQAAYFFGDTGLFAQVGVGAGIGIASFEDDDDVKAGFKSWLGGGWEFFVNSDLALGVSLNGGYVILSGDDLITASFAFEMRYY